MAKILLAKRTHEDEAQAAVKALEKEFAGKAAKFESVQDGETWAVMAEGKPGEMFATQNVEQLRYVAVHAGRMPEGEKREPVIANP